MFAIPAYRHTLFKGGGGTLYLGPVATRSFSGPRQRVTASKQAMARTWHFARDRITHIQFIEPNFYCTGASIVETAIGAVLYVDATVELPGGTCVPVTWNSGDAQGVVPDGGQLLSDLIELPTPIENGEIFFLRRYLQNASGLCISAGIHNNPGGDRLNYGASGIANQISGGSVTTIDSGNHTFPSVILGYTRKPTAYLLGDSRTYGGGTDTYTDSSGDLGNLGRSIGPYFAYVNGGVGNLRASQFAAGRVNQQAVAAYCSHIILELGVNDFTLGSRTSTQILADRATIRAMFPTKTIFDTTIEPITTGSWGDAASQTVAAWNGDRQTFNTAIMAMAKSFDIASPVEDLPTNPGKWKSPGYTADGTHETSTGYAAIRDSGAISAARITR